MPTADVKPRFTVTDSIVLPSRPPDDNARLGEEYAQSKRDCQLSCVGAHGYYL